MSSTENPKPEVYGPKCGGHDAMSDAHNCRQQQNQQQTSIAKSGGAGCKVVSPQASGGVEVNSPHNNASNANGLTESLNQSRANAKYDTQLGNRNVDNSAGAGGGRKKRTTKKHRKRRASQKSRRRKVYVGCNKRSRNRMGGKTKRLSGWGCMSGGKRKTRKFKKHYMWNTKGKRYMAKTYKQHIRGKKLGHTHTKPKRKSKKTRKTRKTRRRGGDMRPGSPEHTAELERRKKDRAQGLNVREEADKRLEADKRKKEERMENQRTIMRTMAGMEQQNIEASKRHSVPNMPTTSNDFSPVRDRARTMG
jgi:hypothetical protein